MTLNPVLRIDTQMIEAVRAHERVSRERALARSRATRSRRSASRRPTSGCASYPHQFSGGMRQRVAIAIALLQQARRSIIADEPTTALDVTIQGQILRRDAEARAARAGTALIWITHDLSVVAGLADDICVMYAGRIVEQGTVDDVLDRPLHPYTRGPDRLGAEPQPRAARRCAQIPGMTPSLLDLPPGCAFRPAAPRDRRLPAPSRRSPTSAARRVRCFHPIHAEDEAWQTT